MKKLILGLVLCLGFITGLQVVGRAQQGQPIDNAKKVAILQLLDVTGAKQNLELFSNAIKENIKKQSPEMPDNVMEEFNSILNYDSMVATIIPIYDRHWSLADIKGMVAFYKTPLGQRMIKEMPAILKESMAASMKRSEEIGRRVQQKLQELNSSEQDSTDQQPPQIMDIPQKTGSVVQHAVEEE